MSFRPKPEVTRWWWVRHAPAIDPLGGNPTEHAYGHLNVAADTSDREAFRRLATALPENAIWLTSQLRRTHDTAAALAEEIAALGRADPPPPLIDPDLAEQHFGHWQGLHREAIAAWQDDESERFWNRPAFEPPPGGESFAEQVARVGRSVERLLAEFAGRDLVAVVHGGTIRAALAKALDVGPVEALAFEIDNLSLTRIDHYGAGESRFLRARGPWRVLGVNMRARLPASDRDAR